MLVNIISFVNNDLERVPTSAKHQAGFTLIHLSVVLNLMII